MNVRFAPAALCLLFVASAVRAQSARPLADALDPILDAPSVANAWWGASVVDLSSGRVLYRRNGGRSFMPASNVKLFTTAAALDLLGPEYRWRTELYVDGPVSGGALKGNLIVRGSGDPSVGGRYRKGDLTAIFRAWADSLHAAGIRVVEGDVIGDDDVFDDVPYGESWAWDDEVYAYSAAVSGLSFNDNSVDVTITARRPPQPAHVSWEPDGTDYVRIVNRTITTAPGTALREGYARRRGTNVIVLSSKVPRGRTDRESLAVENPTLYFVHILRRTLVDRGIHIGGRPVDVDELSIRPDYASPQYRLVAVHRSPPLRVIAETVNSQSQNLHAELILKTLGVEWPPSEEDDIEPGSAEAGLRAATETYAAAGVDTSRLQLVDGSGLSRKNLATPDMTVALLAYMAGHKDDSVRRAFMASLAVGGRTGTLAGRFPNGPEVRAKTGSLGNVTALSGYVTTHGGVTLAFAFLCNHHTAKSSAVRRLQDRAVARLAAWR